jgi:hypothetical protein
LRSFIEKDFSEEINRTEASSRSLPATDTHRSATKTSHQGNNRQVSSRSLDKITSHHQRSNSKEDMVDKKGFFNKAVSARYLQATEEDKVDKKRFFKKAVSARYLQATVNENRPKRNKSVTEDLLGGRNHLSKPTDQSSKKRSPPSLREDGDLEDEDVVEA